MRWMLLTALLIPIPASADEICEGLWFSRNEIFARAGHCFGSALGRAVFGTRVCTPGAVDLGADAQRFVDRVRRIEARRGCNIDTTQTRLDAVPESDFESSCIGWLGAEVALFATPDSAAPVIGGIRRGDQVNYEYSDRGTWSYLLIYRDGDLAETGWAQAGNLNDNCQDIAG